MACGAPQRSPGCVRVHRRDLDVLEWLRRLAYKERVAALEHLESWKEGEA
jgi:hypothetical protein